MSDPSCCMGERLGETPRAYNTSYIFFINSCLSQILRIRWPQRISNQDLWQRTSQRPIMDDIKQRKWRWIGHTLRRPGKHCKTSPGLEPSQGKLWRGRPTMTWHRNLEVELKPIRMSWGAAKHKWKDAVKALCSKAGVAKCGSTVARGDLKSRRAT